ncbi:hypothetical protein XENOCAPTIV_017383 [Xenoophorus captivus]|uniref:SH3 domain-containing protein n=1 Tax=Xenoophorus captivus TaxID=1517983 RepID=A0ABV0S9D6_9TELE
MEGGSGNPFYQPDGLLGDMDSIHSANRNVELGDKSVSELPGEVKGQSLSSDSCCSSSPSVTMETPKDTESTNKASASTQPNSSPAPERSEDKNNNSQRGVGSTHNTIGHTPSSPSPPALPSVPKAKRTNLKKPSSERTGHGLRVKFNPLALLLDASLEGEFDLVQRIIYEVENPSMPNDEGITPLHNAVCAGHHHIVKFLLDFGVNVNAADSDGWSVPPTHLPWTLCSPSSAGVQEKLGVMNKGLVYALWDYMAQQDDELTFSEGDAITVLRRHDDTETEWWWARLEDREGYVPRNLMGVRATSIPHC